ncbi:MAG: BrnA antitoxin family protein [Rhizobiales bacterium]|nr:BrnA antitoxin family protein [Hyphomicrobiales bacterium]
MSKKSSIVRYSAEEIRRRIAHGEDKTRPNAPVAKSLGKNFWNSAKVVMPRNKAAVSLRVDADVLDWFKSQGPGHLSRMNAVLRSYVEASRGGKPR